MRLPLSRSIAAGLVLALASTAAQGQGPPGMSDGFNPDVLPMMGGPEGAAGLPLVLSPAVQDELGLSEKQKGQLKKLQTAMAQKGRDGIEAARQEGLDPQEIMQGMAGLRRELDLSTARVLDKAQKARLAQLELQRDGLMAVARSDVAGKIKLTSAQAKKVKTILAEMNQARFKAMPAPPAGAAGQPGELVPQPGAAQPGAGGFFGAMPDVNSEEFKAQFAKMAEVDKKLRATAVQKIGEVLTKEQAEAFEKLQGEPFDLGKLAATPPPAATDAAAPKADATKAASAPAKAKSKSRKNTQTTP